MCALGRRGTPSSSVPARNRTTSAPASLLYSGDPQQRQKCRVLPSVALNAAIQSAPAVMSNPATGTGVFAAKGTPCAFRHWEQWQYTTGPGLALIR